MKGAAVARLFSRIVVWFDQARKRGGWLPDETEFRLWPVEEAARHALTDRLTQAEEEFLHDGDVRKLVRASDDLGWSADDGGGESPKNVVGASDNLGSSAGRRP